jgi:hypothetical protein
MKERMKRNAIVPILYALLGMLYLGALPSEANDDTKQRTLKLQPEADTDGDGVLSNAEEAVLIRRALKRYPNADTNGDGTLSDDQQFYYFGIDQGESAPVAWDI